MTHRWTAEQLFKKWTSSFLRYTYTNKILMVLLCPLHSPSILSTICFADTDEYAGLNYEPRMLIFWTRWLLRFQPCGGKWGWSWDWSHTSWTALRHNRTETKYGVSEQCSGGGGSSRQPLAHGPLSSKPSRPRQHKLAQELKKRLGHTMKIIIVSLGLNHDRNCHSIGV